MDIVEHSVNAVKVLLDQKDPKINSKIIYGVNNWMNIPPPELLLIVPTFNHFDYAKSCVESFIKNTPDTRLHIAIIDDASTGWHDINWKEWPQAVYSRIRYDQNAGLTRSWNTGLRLAKDIAAEYTICGNSDILFSPGWYLPLKRALKTFCDLVGPVTNAPGHCKYQNAYNFGITTISDNPKIINNNAQKLYRDTIKVVRTKRINGFCMMAKTTSWWLNAFDQKNVFNPKYKLIGNEDELQARWIAKGYRIAFVPNSFVFHYRSVSRQSGLQKPECQGAYRKRRIRSSER